MTAYKFTKYESIAAPELIFYGLEFDGVERLIGQDMFIEVTTDFKGVHMVKKDSVRAIGTTSREYA